MTPKNEMKIEAGDAIAFWVTSTDKAGNVISDLGVNQHPRFQRLG